MNDLFYPKSVVIIGASPRKTNLGRSIVENLLRWGYSGGIYCVGKSKGELFGLPLYTSIGDLPEKPDLAVIIIPAKLVPRQLEECGVLGIKTVAIPAGGFAELGKAGEELSRKLIETAKTYGIRFVGPNCLTVICSQSRLCLPFLPIPLIKEGNISIIAQSGGIGLDFINRLRDHGEGISKFASMGNKISIDETDFLEYFIKDEDTQVIAIYLEDIQKGRKFLDICKGSKKPIIIYKANVEEMAREQAMSHTAAVANNEDVLRGAFRQAKLISVNSLRELACCARAFCLPQLRGNRIALISPTGGILVVASDKCAHYGFELPPLSDAIRIEIEKSLRAGVTPIKNPLDLGDVHDPESRVTIIETLMSQEYIDGAIFIPISRISEDNEVTTMGLAENTRNILPDIERIIEKYEKPIFFSLLGSVEVQRKARALIRYPIFDDVEDAIMAAAASRDHYYGRLE